MLAKPLPLYMPKCDINDTGDNVQYNPHLQWNLENPLDKHYLGAFKKIKMMLIHTASIDVHCHKI